MAPKIERVSESFPTLEGPHWDPLTQCLYFVECSDLFIVRYNPATKKITKASVGPKQATFIIPVEGKRDHFVIPLNNELVLIKWDGESDVFTTVEKLCVADDTAELPNNKFNDAKCDSTGRLWAGTMNITLPDIAKSPPVGTLYSFNSKRELKGHVGKLRLTNGLDFNEKTGKMFHIDSVDGTVSRFDFDVEKGTLANREVWYTLGKKQVPEVLDGMAIDTDGNLWIAIFGGSRVIKIDGSKPETLLETIEMPAVQVTSLTFGGANLDELYVTTASVPVLGEAPPPPANGALYRITGLGVRGLPGNKFRLD